MAIGASKTVEAIGRDLTTFWGNFKDGISLSADLPHSALHVHAGLAVYLLSAIVLRRPLSSPLPFAVVAALQLINEVADVFRFVLSGWSGMPRGTAADTFNTLLWPLMFFIFARVTRNQLPMRTSTSINDSELA